MALADAHLRSGKVRDLFAIGPDRLLLLASDRLSAFDVVLPTPIPDKGRVLTGLSRFWFAETADIVPNHLLSTDPADLPEGWLPGPEEDREADAAAVRGRMMICRRVEVLPVEVVVRGYLSGSGWKEYRTTGSVCGIRLPDGLRESDRLPEPILTPATKAEAGLHDENIPFEAMAATVGEPLASRVREIALALYARGSRVADRAGIILADTKFEFGVEPAAGELLLVDEVMTPDSSRFWDAAAYEPGRAQASFDKQYVRDWLEAQPWDKTHPGPALPAEVVAGTRRRYVEAFERLTGATFERYLEEDVIAS
jgi:phosphoribosylaminoimidazole-succinocarboxamide synthase